MAHTQFRVIQGQLNDGSNVIRRERSQGIFEFPEFSSTNTPTLIPKGSGNSDYWKLEEERRRALLLKDALSLKKPERDYLQYFYFSFRVSSGGYVSLQKSHVLVMALIVLLNPFLLSA